MKTSVWVLLIVAFFSSSQSRAQLCPDVESCWPHVVTSDNHTIIISSVPTLNGSPLSPGSYIGIFFNGASGLQCAGKVQWTGSVTSLAAFGDDGSNPRVGFLNGEAFTFKYLLPSGEIVDSVVANFVAPPGPSGILTHSGFYANSGISQVDVMNGILAVACDPVDCDDLDPCTSDTCDNGNCAHTSIPCSAAISGAVISETGIPIPTVALNLTGSETQNSITATDGLYNFDVPQGGSFTITPSKNNDSTYNSVSITDIILIQKHILSIEHLNSPYKIIAADVNGTPPVSVLDIVLIRSVILGINTIFPNGRQWAFVPDDYVFPDSLNPFGYPSSHSYPNISSDKTGENFIGMKLGDVNNSWTPNNPKIAAVGEVQFIIDEQIAQPGDEIVIPIKVKNFNDIMGYQFTLSWDADVLSLLEVNNKALMGYFGEQHKSEGLLTTLWNDEMAKAATVEDEAVLFELKFKIIGENGTQSSINIGSEITASEAYNAHLDLLNIISANGTVKVSDASGTLPLSDEWNLSVTPNPFMNTANITFAIPHDEVVEIAIYDLMGKSVKNINAAYQKGTYSIEWNGRDQDGHALSKGVYYLRMKAGDYAAGTKMIFIG